MSHKTITLTNEAYERLSRLKNEDESFSQLILRLTESLNKENILSFAGIWSDKPEWGAIEKAIYERRLRPHDRRARLDVR